MSNQNVADTYGSKLLRIKAADKSRAEYRPGHVLALRIPNVEEEHTPGKHGDGRTGPYTIMSCDTKRGIFSILYRVVEDGRMSQRLDKAARNSPILFGGKFKVPIGDGIAPGAEHVIGISTGVGLGPLVGFAEEELAGTDRRVTLFGGFRDVSDIVLQDELDELAREYPDRFVFMPCISSLRDERYPLPAGLEGLRGRVTEAAPRVMDANAIVSGRVHVHLIGNGAMVNLMRKALQQMGMPRENITDEIYFNHKEEPSERLIAELVRSLEAQALSFQQLQWNGAET